MTSKKQDGYVFDEGSGLMVKDSDRRAMIEASSQADETEIILQEAVGAEFMAYAYEFPGSEGKMQRGLAVGGVFKLYEVHYAKNKVLCIPTFTDMQVHVEAGLPEQGTIFTVGIKCVNPAGITNFAVCSSEQHPLRKGSKTDRFFNKHAVATALSCAKRNAMRDLIPKPVRLRFLAEVIAAKHGTGRLVTLQAQAKKVDRKATDAWVSASGKLHAIASKMGIPTEPLHKLMHKQESKYLNRKVESINQLSHARVQAWADRLHELNKCADDDVQLMRFRKAVGLKPILAGRKA